MVTLKLNHPLAPQSTLTRWIWKPLQYISFATLIIPLIMLIAKVIFRSKNSFQVSPPKTDEIVDAIVARINSTNKSELAKEDTLGGDSTLYSLHCADGWYWSITRVDTGVHYNEQFIYLYSLYSEMEGRERRELEKYAPLNQDFIPYYIKLTLSQTCKIMRAFKSAGLVNVGKVPDGV